MAAECAEEFMKSKKDLGSCQLFLVGKNEADEIDIWLLQSHFKSEDMPIKVHGPSKTLIKDWCIIGVGSQERERLAVKFSGYDVDMSTCQAWEIAKETTLQVSLTHQGIGGHIIIHTITPAKTELITCLSVPKMMLLVYNDFIKEKHRSLFVITLDHVTNPYIVAFFRNANLTKERRHLLHSHTIGPMRGGYILRRVVFRENVAAEVLGSAYQMFKRRGLKNMSADPLLKKLPFLVLREGSQLYLAEATKTALGVLCGIRTTEMPAASGSKS